MPAQKRLQLEALLGVTSGNLRRAVDLAELQGLTGYAEDLLALWGAVVVLIEQLVDDRRPKRIELPF